jgi:hypothetical protein
MTRRAVLAVVGWLAAAAAATATGLVAVALIGTGITGPAGPVLGEREVARDLAAASGEPSTGTPSTGSPLSGSPSVGTPSTGAPATTGTPGSRTPFVTPGGTVVARCDGRTVSLVLYSPAQGYAVKQADAGPDDRAEVTFEGQAGRVEVRVTCAAGQPSATWKQDN